MLELLDRLNSFELQPENPEVKPFLLSEYTKSDLEKIENWLGTSLNLNLSSTGFPKASERCEGNDETNYNAVWVRDSVWIYLAMKESPKDYDAAKKLLVNLLDYFSSPAQLERLENPQRVRASAMNALHIRFSSSSPTFEDVQVDGKPQLWNHKQNDALGLAYACFLKDLNLNQLSENQWKFLKGLPYYFDKIEYEKMEDSGAWEEIERVNSSSIGIVVHALETLQEKLENDKLYPRFGFSREFLQSLIDRGYSTLSAQIPKESPAYSKGDPRYRAGDSALLSLLYPCNLKKWDLEKTLDILKEIQPLIGAKGIKRYLGDAYQSGNYWKKSFSLGHTEDASNEGNFFERLNQMIPNTEAEWFFDSWLSLIAARLYLKTQDETFKKIQIRCFHRALCQITSPFSMGADGKKVHPKAFPESYNVLVNANSTLTYAPSPITPLNWAIASFRLAKNQLLARNTS